MAKNAKLEAKLSQLMEQMIDGALDKIKSGDYTAQDYNNFLKLLAHNGIDIEIKTAEIPQGMLTPLPFQSDHLMNVPDKDKN